MKVIDSRRELFVDDWLIDCMDGTRLKLHTPVPGEIALQGDGSYSYVTVFKDRECYRAYYRAGEPYDITRLTNEDYDRQKKMPQVTAYAESPDGITWTVPELGLIEHKGTRANNIVWDAEGACTGTSHNFSPFLDGNPAAPPEERYKALGGTRKTGLIAFAAADALNWRPMRQAPVITDGAFDSQNLAFWDAERNQYVAFVRDFLRVGSAANPEGARIRCIKRCTSQDFLHWSTPEWIDLGDTPLEHLYTNAATPYFGAPHIYVAFPRRFVPERKALPDSPLNGISDQIFMSSRDGGMHWDRRFMEAFVRPGPERENWTDRNGTIAYGVVPINAAEMSIYWTEHNKMPTCRLRRATLRTDGFASVNAPYAGGEFVTRPLLFSGDTLYLNYATSAVGSLQVEIQDVCGNPLPGFSLTEALYGDQIDAPVRFGPDADLGALSHTPVRLRFLLRDADLYALQFRQDDAS